MKTSTPVAESSQTQDLIELCLGLAANPELLTELLEKAEIRIEDMHHAEDGFFAGVEAEEPEFYHEFRPQIERVEDAFNAYGDALERILTKSFDADEVAQALAQASRGLRVSMAAYEEAYLSKGPSGYPVVNLFENIAQGVTEGRISPAAWAAACARYKAYYAGALREIEESRARQKPGVTERKAALAVILEGLSEFEKLSGGEEDFPSILARFAAAHTDLDRAFDSYHRQEFAQGPAQGPNINWLVKATKGVLDGTYQPAVLESMAQALLDITQQNLADLKAMSRDKSDSAVLNEELERMLAAVTDIEDVLLFLLDYADGRSTNREQVLVAIDDLIESGDALMESARFVAQIGQVTCVQCQTSQDKGVKTCVSCGALLPQQPDQGVYDVSTSSSFQLLEGDPTDLNREEVMTDVMHALFEACEAFMKGTLPVAELTTRVGENLHEVERAQRRLDQLRTPVLPQEASPQDQETAQDFIDLAEDALILLSQGVAECRQGLSTIQESALVDDLETLRSGMRRYFEGTQKMWQVRRLERDFDDYLGTEESSE